MINIKKIQITQKGFSDLQREHDQLVNSKRPRLVERLERARNEGDLSENSDYINAKEELEFLDGRIEELKSVLDHAEVISCGKSNGTVQVGTKVKVQIDGEETDFEIVGEWEADPVSKKISHESPLGKSLMGKKVGEEVEVEAPAGKITYKIKSIN
jgi:transcription elongation factor GreA